MHKMTQGDELQTSFSFFKKALHEVKASVKNFEKFPVVMLKALFVILENFVTVLGTYECFSF